MLWLAAAAIAASSSAPQAAPAPVAVEATATVRIVSGVRLSLTSPTNAGAPPAHDSTITTDGTRRTVRLIEFQ